jgi:CheY-like chemotaxis protein
MRILVVEDAPIELKLALHVLTAAGHDVQCVDTAEGAAAAIESHCPDIILLDLCLPGMDGLTLARKLKNDAATRDIAIFAVTSFPEKYPRADAFAAGCDGYLRKPLSTRTLPELLAAAVKNADGRSET